MKKGNLLWVCVLCSWEAWDSKICTSPFSAFSAGHVTDKFAGSIAFTTRNQDEERKLEAVGVNDKGSKQNGHCLRQ